MDDCAGADGAGDPTVAVSNTRLSGARLAVQGDGYFVADMDGARPPSNRWTNVDPSSFAYSGPRPPQRVSHGGSSPTPPRDVGKIHPNVCAVPWTVPSPPQLRLSSPCSADSRCQQASLKHVSRFDFAALGDSFYHGGPNGLTTLSEPEIQARGYTNISFDDVVLCFNDIISLHAKVMATWTNIRTQLSGPLVERIVEKAVPGVLPCLEGLTTAEMVMFYDNLQKISDAYLLPLMPFDALNLALGFEGLCPPGLGTHRYGAICRALIEILPCLLPSLNRVSTVVSTMRADNRNGYALLWEVMALAVPGFDPTLHVAAPLWDDYLDVLNFCNAHLLYFRLQAKIGLYYNDCKKSCTFLHSVENTEYVDVVTILQTHVETYIDQYDDGYLPPHLCLVGLAQWLDKHQQSRVCDVLPHAHRLHSMGVSSDRIWYPSGLIQGSSPQVYCAELPGRGHDTWSPQNWSSVGRGGSDRDDRDAQSCPDDRPTPRPCGRGPVNRGH